MSNSEKNSSPHNTPTSESKATPAIGKKTNQLDYLQKVVMKSLCRHRCASPFLEPVDPEKHNVPDYLDVIKIPMDLGTVNKKLSARTYTCANECINDVELVFQNCFVYNGQESEVSKMCRELKSVYESKLQGMPEQEEDITSILPTPKKKSHDISPVEMVSGKRKISKCVPYHDAVLGSELDKSKKKKIQHTTNEIHTTNGVTTKNGSVSYVGSRSSIVATKREPRITTSKKLVVIQKNYQDEARTQSGLKHAMVLVKELMSKKYEQFAWPFYQPVDPEALKLIDYREIVKHPRDLSTIKKKLENSSYSCAHECVSDLRLMLSNCYRYNPPTSDVVVLAKKFHEVMEFHIARLDGDLFTQLAVYCPPSPTQITNFATTDCSYSGYSSLDADVLSSSPPAGFLNSKKTGKTHTNSKGTTAHELHEVAHLSDNGKDLPSNNQNDVLVMLESRVKELYAQLSKLRDEKSSSVESSTSFKSEQKSNGSVTPGEYCPKKIESCFSSDCQQLSIVSPTSLVNPSTNGCVSDSSEVNNFQGNGGDSCVIPRSMYDTAQNLIDNDDVEPMCYDEMRQLTISVTKLPAEKVLKILQIIQRREPELRKSDVEDETEVEIDLEQLRPGTLREIQRFVSSSLKKKRPLLSPASVAVSNSLIKKNEEEIAQRKEMIEKRLENVRHHFIDSPTLLASSINADISAAGISSAMSSQTKKSVSSTGITSKIEAADCITKGGPMICSNVSDADSDTESEIDSKQILESAEATAKDLQIPASQSTAVSFNNVAKSFSSSLIDPLAALPDVVAKLDRVEVPYPIRKSQPSIQAKTTGLSMISTDVSIQSDSNFADTVSVAVTDSVKSAGDIIAMQRMKQEEQRKRLAIMGKVDMNAQSDLLSSFEQNL